VKNLRKRRENGLGNRDRRRIVLNLGRGEETRWDFRGLEGGILDSVRGEESTGKVFGCKGGEKEGKGRDRKKLGGGGGVAEG